MLTFIAITVGSVIALHVVLFALIKLFGRGGTGTIGDIQKAIGRALPMPLGIAIWVVAITLIAQKLVENYQLKEMLHVTSGEHVMNVDELLSMFRIGLLVMLATWFIARSIRSFCNIINNWHSEKDDIELDTTAIQAIASICIFITWSVGFIVMLQSMGLDMSAVVAVGGIAGVGIAFASRDVIASFFGGIIIMINRPFKVGDQIKSGSNVEGKVTRIGLYATQLKTKDGNPLYVPNSILNNSEILVVHNPIVDVDNDV